MKDNRKEYIADTESRLMDFLLTSDNSLTRNKAKSRLAHRQVLLNGMPETRYDAEIKPGDRVSVVKGVVASVLKHPMLRIVFEDESIIVIDKRNGLLSVGTDKERNKTAFYILSDHVKKSDPSNRIFIVHRLDRETSGLMVFAKSQAVQEKMQRNWNTTVVDRKYVAVVEGDLPSKEGEIDACLSENKNFKVYVDARGEKAVTRYKVLEKGDEYSLVELTLDTGKKNQIRAHLEHLGCPIAGDKKYGALTNPIGRVCLHAHVLHLIHPLTGEKHHFRTAIPQIFENTVKDPAD